MQEVRSYSAQLNKVTNLYITVQYKAMVQKKGTDKSAK